MLCRKKAESYSYFQITGVWLRICVQVMLIIYEKNTEYEEKNVDIPEHTVYYINVRCEHAEVAELADAQASGACGSNTVWVQVPSSAFFYTIVCDMQSCGTNIYDI